MRLFRSGVAGCIAAAVLILPTSAAMGQSIDPATFEATMSVGETITINKTITLGASGANLVDLFFLADNTGSMGGEILNMKNGASAILGNVPAGADYNFGVGRYFGDPVEGVPPATAYQENTPIGPSAAAAQAGINAWVASGGADFPEANFFALKEMASTADWRLGSQRLAIWFGDAPSHTATTTQAEAIAALNAAGVTVIGFNSGSAGSGMDQGGQAAAVTAGTGGSLTHGFNSISTAAFVAAVNAEISTATSTLDLVFGTDFGALYGSGLSFSFVCTDPLGCTGVTGGESRTFDVHITADEVGTYDFSVFAEGVSAAELDMITVVDGTVPEPATMALLATGLLGLGAIGYRRKEEAA